MASYYQTARVFVLCLLIIIFGRSASAANPKISSSDSTHRILRTTTHIGLVVPHHADMAYFINNFSYGLDFNFGMTKYNRSWYKYLNYPEVGFGMFYNTFGNSEIYGYGLSGYGYILSNLFRSKQFSMQSKVALGLGIVNKSFHVDKNPYNHVFGSTMNVFINLGLLTRYKIGPRWSISGSLSINHLSNGAIKKPNHGINTVMCGVGVEYNLNNAGDPDIAGKVRAPLSNARDVVFFLSLGTSQSNLHKQDYYPAASFNINHLWWISKKTAWGIGVDGIYYGAAPFEYSGTTSQFLDGEKNYTFSDKMYGGLFGSYNFQFNHTQIFAHVGVYLLYTIKPIQLIYPRMGVRQQIYKNLYANFSIKASFFKAEFIEFGLGYHLNYKKNQI